MTRPYRPLMTQGEVRRALARNVGPNIANTILATLGLPPMTEDEYRQLADAATGEERPDVGEAAEELAANVRSFVGALPFVAPEALQFHVDERLKIPLAEYDQARKEQTGG